MQRTDAFNISISSAKTILSSTSGPGYDAPFEGYCLNGYHTPSAQPPAVHPFNVGGISLENEADPRRHSLPGEDIRCGRGLPFS